VEVARSSTWSFVIQRKKMRTVALIVLSVGLTASACSQVLAGQQRPAIDAKDVKLYTVAPPRTRAAMEQEVERLWNAKSYAELDQLDDAVRGADQVSLSGYSLRYMLHEALYANLSAKSSAPIDWPAIERSVRDWTVASPSSSLAQVTYAGVYLAQAWAIRGDGYASTVSPSQWTGFYENVSRAKAYLLARRELGRSNPAWYQSMARILQWTSAPDAEYRLILDEGLDRFPTNFPLYAAAIDHYSSKWGGSPGEIAKFADRSTSKLPIDTRDELYSRIYSYALQQYPIETAPGFDCTRLLRGGEQLVARYPTPYNRHQAARATYECKDRVRATGYFQQLGPDPQPGVWGYGPGAVAEYGRAKAWANVP
jgi:hypothetical protein